MNTYRNFVASARDRSAGAKRTVSDRSSGFAACLIVPIQDQVTLSQVKPDLALIRAISADYNLIGYYLYSKSGDQTLDATARMFAPFYGIDEEAATGMAASPLACFLWAIGLGKKHCFGFSRVNS